jgi:hypothetical protein
MFDNIEKNESDVACNTYGGGEWVLVGKPESDQLGDPGIDRRVILKWMFNTLKWIFRK